MPIVDVLHVPHLMHKQAFKKRALTFCHLQLTQLPYNASSHMVSGAPCNVKAIRAE